MSLPATFQALAHLFETQQTLSNVTYMKVGGPADYLARAHTIAELVMLVNAAKAAGIRVFLLGGGSNTIFSDAGFRGLVIINQTHQVKIIEDSFIQCDSGCTTNSVVNFATQSGLSGLENFLGIPGTIGGAIYNNSHYLDQLIGDSIDSALLLKSSGEQSWVNREYFDFRYDYSVLHQTKEILLEVKLKLYSGDKKAIQEKATAALLRRKNSQPLHMPSSGCMFQNFKQEAINFPKIPKNITSAGALIDTAGLKGLSRGGAQVSTVHANFIVNNGGATVEDIIGLSNQIIEIIHKQYGLTLKREVFLINEFGERTDL